ncbi:MAG: hypothetical protein RL220_548, partial [Bacteroidota bacterium]
MARNTIKNTPQEEPAEEPKKPSRKSRKAEADYEEKGGIRGFMADKRVRKITGILLVVISLFLFVSFVSYLFSANHDLRLIVATDGDTVLSQREPYRNVMGKVGAHASYFFMNRYVGIGALFIAFLLFLTGIRVWLNRNILPYFKSVRLSVLGMLYFPLLIGFMFHHRVDAYERVIDITCNQNLVGTYGHFATEWMTYTLGWTGTLLTLIFVLGAYLIFNFNHHVEAFWARLWDLGKKSSSLITPEKDEWDEEPVAAAAPAPAVAEPPTGTNTMREPEPTTITVQHFPEEEPEVTEAEEEVEEPEEDAEELEEEEELIPEPQAFQV